MKESRRILVVGAGAVGGITAAILAREQYDIWLVAKFKGVKSGRCANALWALGF